MKGTSESALSEKTYFPSKYSQKPLAAGKDTRNQVKKKMPNA